MTKNSGPITMRAIAVMLMPLVLAGCFLAENEAEDPIIPDDALAYPLAMGEGRECELDEDGAEECKSARFEKAAGGGYQLTTLGEGEDGKAVPVDSGEFRLRQLVGDSIPEQTYLAQQVSNEVDQRFLGLLVKRNEGGWRKTQPQCDNLSAEAFVRFVNDRWLQTREGETLKDLTCFIRREGLTDERVYAILAATRDTGRTIYYD